MRQGLLSKRIFIGADEEDGCIQNVPVFDAAVSSSRRISTTGAAAGTSI